MSFSNPKQTNPASKFIEFKGDKGIFQYYDKTLDEPANVELLMPLIFIVLDELSTITGFSKKFNSSFYSNEIHSLNDEILKVRSFKGGFSLTGKYADIKTELAANSAKFTKSVYAMLILNKEKFEFVHFKFAGSVFGAWMDKGFSVQEFIVGVKSTKQETSGNNKYLVPIFEKYKMPKEKCLITDTAFQMDRKLQEYLKAYKAGQLEKMEIETVASIQNDETEQPVKSEFDVPKHQTQYDDVSDVRDLPF